MWQTSDTCRYYIASDTCNCVFCVSGLWELNYVAGQGKLDFIVIVETEKDILSFLPKQS